MKNNVMKYILIVLASMLVMSCGKDEKQEQEDKGHAHAGHAEGVRLSTKQLTAMNMKMDAIPKRNIASFVETNGELEIPPQNEAVVSTAIGANVVSIEVIEGDEVSKGKVLAYISHPDLIQLQMDYNKAWNQLQYLEKDFQRKKRLYEEEIGSGREFQKIDSDLKSMKGTVNGLSAQLSLLGIGVTSIQSGNILERIAIRSPIDGFVRKVDVNIGQYVSPQTELFDIVNLEHIHADFMVYENDIAKVKEGQKIRFTVGSSDIELEAKVYSVGKNFEENPKAVHIHAEIENKQGLLLPGMYARGKILIGDKMSDALPEEAIVVEEDNAFIFTVRKERNQWVFEAVEISLGKNSDGWIEVIPKKRLDKEQMVVWNNAYYLMAEMKKEEAEHSH
ncbi:MAG: efflux RND transporter periplasmic adaptor subunit [Flavobacteriales bacterium]|nr:efflux RND transporter periplasmic adaptor subunit [Flavobacteriales bacterium]